MDNDLKTLENEILGRKSPPIPPAPPFTPSKDTPAREIIEQKRAELELKKLEIEIERLGTPNTQIDYFKQMLEQQENHFKQLLEMERQHQKLALEIERMKLIGEGDNDDLMGKLIEPLLPQLLQANALKGGGDVLNKTTPIKMDINEYAKCIQEGKITEEMAYEDFKLERPDLAKLTPYEIFKKNFDYMKANGKPPEKVLT